MKKLLPVIALMSELSLGSIQVSSDDLIKFDGKLLEFDLKSTNSTGTIEIKSANSRCSDDEAKKTLTWSRDPDGLGFFQSDESCKVLIKGNLD